tara:strand:+ start:499 stop:1191 length:693 start_codon:yes stop_codon:yes gene_type:complete
MEYLNCIVTGASSGIGKEISIELSRHAKHIYISARNIKKLEDVYDKIIKNDCKCTIVPLDLCNENGIENLANEISKKDDCIDVVVLSAGSIGQLSPVESINLTKLQEIINLNYLSNFRMIKNFHLLLKNSRFSKLALISSIADHEKSHYWGIYQPIMTALNELLITYANENLNTSIKANIFIPKSVDTDFRNNIMPGEDKSNTLSPQFVAKKVVKYILATKETGKIFEIN